MSRRNFGQYVHDKLAEPPGQEFVYGKWRFWLLAVVFLSALNAILTALIFKDDAQDNYVGPIMLSVGALLGWLCIGCLHYSDSSDRRMARGVAGLDSATLVFVAAHFCGLLYVYGHASTLRAAEVKYAAAAEKFNVEAKQVQLGNIAIAQAAQAVAQEQTKAERLRNDTAYQNRKAAEAGRGIPLPRPQAQGSTQPALSTSTVELERPEKPKASSAEFITRWDWLVRLANFGELLLAVLTLIFIRNQSAKTNSPVENFGPQISTGVYRSPISTPAFRTAKKETPKNHGSFDSEGLKILREVLRDISFRLAGFSFKSAVRGDAVWIYLMKANAGTQEATHSAKFKLSILDDAVQMPRDKFRERLERVLIQNEFPIE